MATVTYPSARAYWRIQLSWQSAWRMGMRPDRVWQGAVCGSASSGRYRTSSLAFGLHDARECDPDPAVDDEWMVHRAAAEYGDQYCYKEKVGPACRCQRFGHPVCAGNRRFSRFADHLERRNAMDRCSFHARFAAGHDPECAGKGKNELSQTSFIEFTKKTLFYIKF